MDLMTQVRSAFTRRGQNNPAGTDIFGNLLISQALPEYALLAASGRLFTMNTLAGTAKAPVVAPPTTSPEWMIYNASANEVLVVLEAATFLKSGTLGLGASLVMASAVGPQTAVTANYAGTVVTCCDGSQKVPSVFLADNPTLVNATPAWHVVAATQHNSLATDSVGDGLLANVAGKFVAPPRGGVAVELIGETGTTALFAVSFLFAMLPMDLF